MREQKNIPSEQLSIKLRKTGETDKSNPQKTHLHDHTVFICD
jgi:hypothetical protein